MRRILLTCSMAIALPALASAQATNEPDPADPPNDTNEIQNDTFEIPDDPLKDPRFLDAMQRMQRQSDRAKELELNLGEQGQVDPSKYHGTLTAPCHDKAVKKDKPLDESESDFNRPANGRLLDSLLVQRKSIVDNLFTTCPEGSTTLDKGAQQRDDNDSEP
jgi:hypothetical protein